MLSPSLSRRSFSKNFEMGKCGQKSLAHVGAKVQNYAFNFQVIKFGVPLSGGLLKKLSAKRKPLA